MYEEYDSYASNFSSAQLVATKITDMPGERDKIQVYIYLLEGIITT